jgi:hypothetical protein
MLACVSRSATEILGLALDQIDLQPVHGGTPQYRPVTRVR